MAQLVFRVEQLETANDTATPRYGDIQVQLANYVPKSKAIFEAELQALLRKHAL